MPGPFLTKRSIPSCPRLHTGGPGWACDGGPHPGAAPPRDFSAVPRECQGWSGARGVTVVPDPTCSGRHGSPVSDALTQTDSQDHRPLAALSLERSHLSHPMGGSIQLARGLLKLSPEPVVGLGQHSTARGRRCPVKSPSCVYTCS